MNVIYHNKLQSFNNIPIIESLELNSKDYLLIKNIIKPNTNKKFTKNTLSIALMK